MSWRVLMFQTRLSHGRNLRSSSSVAWGSVTGWSLQLGCRRAILYGLGDQDCLQGRVGTPCLRWRGRSAGQPIMGPRDALRYLQKYFPLRFGQTYWDAINAGISALLHECDPAHARTCFIAAYAECIVTIDDLWQDITCDQTRSRNRRGLVAKQHPPRTSHENMNGKRRRKRPNRSSQAFRS